MVTWPDNIPGPIVDKCAFFFGSTAQQQTWISGRSAFNRFGSGAPDVVSGTIRVLSADVSSFIYLYERVLNFGINWFSASWISSLGYSNSAGRLTGYPRRKFTGSLYSDFSVTIQIKDQWSISADTEW